jgi:hypothetical protein
MPVVQCIESLAVRCFRKQELYTMPRIERNDQPGDQTQNDSGSPSSDESNSGKTETKQVEQPRKVTVKKKVARKKAADTAGGRVASVKKKRSQTRRKAIQNEEPNTSRAETKPIKQPRKVAVKKKTARKKAATTAGGRMASAKRNTSQTSRKEIQPERPSGSDQLASVTGSEAVKAPPAEQNQPEKPVENSVRPIATPPHSQPRPRGGTGLGGFWIKVGASAFVIVAGIIGIYSFFSEDEAASRSEETQAAAGAPGDEASVTNSVAADTETARGVVFPPTAEQSNMVDPESLHGYSNAPGTFAGAAVDNEPVVETAITADVTPGVPPAADQPLASQQDAAPPPPHSGRFSEEPAGYRPELYRPLESEQNPPRATQPSAVSETPRASSVPAPSYYPQPGAYAYPPAPYYRGYGHYYPY